MAAWTQEDLTRINRAIRSGALKVEYSDGKAVTYRRLEDLFAIKGQIEQELGLRGAPLRKVAAHNKGVTPGSIDRSEWN